jgi:hypothetical protein
MCNKNCSLFPLSYPPAKAIALAIAGRQGNVKEQKNYIRSLPINAGYPIHYFPMDFGIKDPFAGFTITFTNTFTIKEFFTSSK